MLTAPRSGKLETARRNLEEIAVDWCSTDEQADLLGHLWFWNGSFMRARMSFALATQYSREHGRRLELARGLRHLARVEEIIGTSNCQDTLEEARELNAALDSSIGIAQVESIGALACLRLDEAAKLGFWSAVLGASPAGADSKRLSAMVLAFLGEAAQGLPMGQDSCEFASLGEARAAWRHVAGLR